MKNQFSKNYLPKILSIIMLGCSVTLGPITAFANETKVSLTGAEETPPVKTSAKGIGSISVNKDKSVTGMVTTTGLAGTLAHIHLGAEGKKGPPIITLVKSGDSGWVVPPRSILTDDQYASYKAGNLYINVHSAENKDGEIRGQLKP
ncbi:CHRD domain-containing protein [Undibacterium sp. RuTC16W]|uniref:CHRD domain-containing protein n=1 Tax=Undibacterium sp. RuTC16W TaxID=3413048 RepID=UPI003BEF674B